MDILSALERIEDESIDCLVTSPPYFSLRDYGKETETIWGGEKSRNHIWKVHQESARGGSSSGTSIVGVNQNNEANNRGHPTLSNYCISCHAWQGQLGLEPSPAEYIDHLMQITSKIKPKMKTTSTFFWNMNDSYASGGGKGIDQSFNREKDVETGQPNNPAKAKLRATLGKSKLLIPEQFAIKMVYEGGWLLRNSIIWHKLSSMPSSFVDRLTNTYEPMFFFTKDKSYYFDLNAIRLKKTYPNQHVKELCEEIYNKAKQMRNQNKLLSYKGKIKANQNSNASVLLGFTIAIRQIAKQTIAEHPELTEREREYINWFQHNQIGNIIGSNPGDVWSLNAEPVKEEHYASFPGKLVRKALLAGCPPSGTVFDPFMGSGTTAKVALDMGLNVIGCEISSKYCNIIEKRCKAKERQQLGQLEYQLIKQEIEEKQEEKPISEVS